MNKVYITTPIFYVNDKPHIGHAYTTIICDSLARFYKLKGSTVLFTTGTDEHGLKVEKAAKNKNMSPIKFVEQVSTNFKDLSKKIELSNTDFIRTTEDRHKKSAQAFWKILSKNNQIYLSKYKGWYSVKDESFYQEKELQKKGDSLYTSDDEKVEWIEEESFFFKLSNWQNSLLDYYEKNPQFILPKSRMNEVKSFVKSGLKDLSISRTSFKWGIQVEESKNHIMYVWIDALVNYLTSIGFPKNKNNLNDFWINCIHVIGKDILKFHAVYWPAMLMAAKLPLPKTIFAHGWWTNEGKKISKSLGNSIDPNHMIDSFGLDQFRFFLLREVTLGQDGDFSISSFKNRINSDLSNNLGNLVQRTLKFISKNFDGEILSNLDSNNISSYPLNNTYKLFTKVERLITNFEVNRALEEIFNLVSILNKFMDDSEPWNVIKKNKENAANIMIQLVECFRVLGIILQPFIPTSAKNLLDTLNIKNDLRKFKCLNSKYAIKRGHRINEPKALFPRFE